MQIYRNGEDITGETIICVAGSTVDNLSVVFTDGSGNDVTDSAMNFISGGFRVSWADRGATERGEKKVSKKKGKKDHDSKDTNLPSIQE